MNDSTTRSAVVLLLSVALLSAPGAVLAAGKKDQGREEARRLQQKVGALEQEKTQLSSEKSELENKLKNASEQVKRSSAAASRKQAELARSLQAAEEEKAALTAKLAAAEQKSAELGKALAETSASLKRTQGQLADAQAQHQQERALYTAKNESLHRAGVELIGLYRQKDWMSSLLQKEPLTGLKAVDAENMLDEYREKLDQEYVERQQDERRNMARQQAIAQIEEQQKAERERIAREQADREIYARVKATQQYELDWLAHAVAETIEVGATDEAGWERAQHQWNAKKKPAAEAKPRGDLERIARKVKTFFETTEW